MFKRAMLFLASFLLVSAFAYAGEKFSVSGEVSFQYEGDVYICLLTSDGLRDFVIPGHRISESPCKLIKLNSGLKKAGKVSFTFDKIPKGTYCVFTYQDVNMNGEVDYENYSPNEPWGSYKDWPLMTTMPVWQRMKFDLNKDITGIKIAM